MSLAVMLRDAMKEYRKMLDEGVPQEDACKGLEYVLRQVIPQRGHTYQCEACNDTGLVVKQTTAVQVGNRVLTARPGESYRVGHPCECKEGVRFQGARGNSNAEDDLAPVGKVKRGGWSRAGR